MKRFAWILVPFVTLFWGCATTQKKQHQAEVETAVIRLLEDIRNRYAPDPHLAIYSISPEREGDYLILKGEVDNPAAKQELVSTISALGIKVVDRLTLLPDEKFGERVWGIGCISVANLREATSPGAELGTQLLMGNVVRIWKRQGMWIYAQTSDRYLGWVEEGSFVACTKEEVNAWNSSKRLILTAYEDRIWEKPAPGGNGNYPVSDIVMGGVVKNLGEEGGWYKVALPDGRSGYLAKASAMDFEDWKNSRQATPGNIEQIAKSFLGFPYLWGGNSSKAMDCSGFTKMVFSLNGVSLSRNASQQARHGTEVPLDPDLNNLKKGDLLFFGFVGNASRPGRVTHVGIYLGDKLFIHSSGRVKISSLDPKSSLVDERRAKSLLSARRYLRE